MTDCDAIGDEADSLGSVRDRSWFFKAAEQNVADNSSKDHGQVRSFSHRDGYTAPDEPQPPVDNNGRALSRKTASEVDDPGEIEPAIRKDWNYFPQISDDVVPLIRAGGGMDRLGHLHDGLEADSSALDHPDDEFQDSRGQSGLQNDRFELGEHDDTIANNGTVRDPRMRCTIDTLVPIDPAIDDLSPMANLPSMHDTQPPTDDTRTLRRRFTVSEEMIPLAELVSLGHVVDETQASALLDSLDIPLHPSSMPLEKRTERADLKWLPQKLLAFCHLILRQFKLMIPVLQPGLEELSPVVTDVIEDSSMTTPITSPAAEEFLQSVDSVLAIARRVHAKLVDFVPFCKAILQVMDSFVVQQDAVQLPDSQLHPVQVMEMISSIGSISEPMIPFTGLLKELAGWALKCSRIVTSLDFELLSPMVGSVLRRAAMVVPKMLPFLNFSLPFVQTTRAASVVMPALIPFMPLFEITPLAPRRIVISSRTVHSGTKRSPKDFAQTTATDPADLGACAEDLGARAEDLGARAEDLGARAEDLGARAGGETVFLRWEQAYIREYGHPPPPSVIRQWERDFDSGDTGPVLRDSMSPARESGSPVQELPASRIRNLKNSGSTMRRMTSVADVQQAATEVFEIVDLDGDGEAGFYRRHQGGIFTGENPAGMNMMTLFNELDHNGENRFSEADWTARWVHEAQQVGSFEAKQKLDRIRQLLEKCQYTRKKREVQLVFDMLDVSCDGKIMLVEVEDALKEHPEISQVVQEALFPNKSTTREVGIDNFRAEWYNRSALWRKERSKISELARHEMASRHSWARHEMPMDQL